MEKIIKDMLIAEVVSNFPQTIEVFFEVGVHCVGCGAASFETIEDGLKVHGATDEDIDEFVEELNKRLEKKTKST